MLHVREHADLSVHRHTAACGAHTHTHPHTPTRGVCTHTQTHAHAHTRTLPGPPVFPTLREAQGIPAGRQEGGSRDGGCGVSACWRPCPSPPGHPGREGSTEVGGWAWVSPVFAVNRSPSAHSPGLLRAGGLQRAWPPPLPTPLPRLMKGLGPEGLGRQLRGREAQGRQTPSPPPAQMRSKRWFCLSPRMKGNQMILMLPSVVGSRSERRQLAGGPQCGVCARVPGVMGRNGMGLLREATTHRMGASGTHRLWPSKATPLSGTPIPWHP